jgi:uncharacterized protein YjbI with pentapeptide repeats
MKVRQRLWWIPSGVFLLLCVGFVIATYRFGWTATGFLNKSLWDWLQLLIVPLVLAVVALVFQLANARTGRQIAQQRYEYDQQIAQQRHEYDQQIAQQRHEYDQQIALDKRHEDLLQAYLDHLAELLLKENLRTSSSEEIRNVARMRTITVLTQLNAGRIGYVFTFLREAGLMSTTSHSSVVSLSNANLRAVKWSQADLSEANLIGAGLKRADLSGANLSGSYLSEADLTGANLSRTNLKGADLIGSYLSEADLTGADLSRANLKGADLSRANLSGASLSEANLSQASLSGARLYGANLSQAHLSQAHLSRADLSGARLYGANLGQANLSGARLYGANLSGASLSQADLSGVTFEDALFLKGTNLHGVKGLTKEQLEACKAKGAIIDEDLTTSSPQLPVSPPGSFDEE